MTTQILDHAPDKILHNGNIVCVDKDFSIVKAVAIGQQIVSCAGLGCEADTLMGS